MEGYTAIEKAIRYFDAHKGIVETLYVKEIVDKLIEFKVEEAKVKNLAQPDVIRSFFSLSTGNQPEYKRACMNQCYWCKEHQHQFQQAQIDKMTVTIKTTIIHEVQQTGVSGRSEQLCGNLDENYNCKNMCLTRCVDGNKFYK